MFPFSQKSPKSLISPKLGFTLIELLVVISIIGILATIVIVNLQTARAKAYDAQRQATVSALHKALVLYQDDNNSQYPAFCDESSDNAGQAVCFNNLVTELNARNLINKDPIPDPHLIGDNVGYLYWSDGDTYVLRYFKEAGGVGYMEL